MLSMNVEPTVLQSESGELTPGLKVQLQVVLPVTEADALVKYLQQAGTQAIMQVNHAKESQPNIEQLTGQAMAEAHAEADAAPTFPETWSK